MHAGIKHFLPAGRQIQREVDALLMQGSEMHALPGFGVNAHHVTGGPVPFALGYPAHGSNAHRCYGVEDTHEI
ncbi:hypothetical protein G6F32_016768 [Rhizopus arrhizus]|nr:hypothetical protein G6F32_016768 [Rhizopus arrhizus]